MDRIWELLRLVERVVVDQGGRGDGLLFPGVGVVLQNVIPLFQVVENDVWVVGVRGLPPLRNLRLERAALHLLLLLLLHQLVHAAVLLDFVAHLP